MPFEYTGKSLLVNEIQHRTIEIAEIPAVIGDDVQIFHDVCGGYNVSDGVDVVELVHEPQGRGSSYRPYPEQISTKVELHLPETYYYMSAETVDVDGDYPEEPYVLSLRVSDYRFGSETFAESLLEDIDKRETKYE
jgi:hypothetical protein